MKLVKVLRNKVINGQNAFVGDILEVQDNQAALLLQKGTVELVKAKTEAKELPEDGVKLEVPEEIILKTTKKRNK